VTRWWGTVHVDGSGPAKWFPAHDEGTVVARMANQRVSKANQPGTSVLPSCAWPRRRLPPFPIATRTGPSPSGSFLAIPMSRLRPPEDFLQKKGS